jgi:hypothetical protein
MDSQEELKEAINGLLNSFPKSFINYNNEFIAHEKSNQYIILSDCKNLLDIECKCLNGFHDQHIKRNHIHRV